jgi:hypothetical protein
MFHSKAPVPLTDDQGNAVLDIQGNPIMRPSDVPPNFFVNAGQQVAGPADALANLFNFDRGAELWAKVGDGLRG